MIPGANEPPALVEHGEQREADARRRRARRAAAGAGRAGPRCARRTAPPSASKAAPTSQIAPIASAPTPSIVQTQRAEDVERAERESPGSATNQTLASMRRFPSAPKRSETGCRFAGWRDGVVAAAAARTRPRQATPPNVASVLVTDAIPPITGPSIAPKIAAPIALPISRPRALAGASATSHASAGGPRACARRSPGGTALSRAAIRCRANPKSAVVTIIPPSPRSSVGLTPNRDASMPAGIPPTSAPSAYEPASTPAPAFESPSSSA